MHSLEIPDLSSARLRGARTHCCSLGDGVGEDGGGGAHLDNR